MHFFSFCSYKFKLEDVAEVKPVIPLFNDRIYDNKFESQFYMISDANKVFWPFSFLLGILNCVCQLHLIEAEKIVKVWLSARLYLR